MEQPVDFYEPDVLTATQSIMSKYYRKPSSLVVFCFIGTTCLANSVKVLKEVTENAIKLKCTGKHKLDKIIWGKWNTGSGA